MKRKLPTTYAEALAGKAKNTFKLGETHNEAKTKSKPREITESDFVKQYRIDRDKTLEELKNL